MDYQPAGCPGRVPVPGTDILFRLRWWVWRLGHTSLALITVIGSVVHALLIQGTMETTSEVILCTIVIAATMKVLVDLRVWTTDMRRKRQA
ncbi:MAG: hypothetical protein ACPGQM_11000 [Alphaproteobacteria bacterium]